MRTNKIIPFLIALLLHTIPVIYFLKIGAVKQPQSNKPLSKIDLSNFSFPNIKNSSTKHLPKNQTKILGLQGQAIQISEGSLEKSFGPNEKIQSYTFINYQEPLYPPVARQKGLEGKVKIKIFYDQLGSVIKIDLLESSGTKMLDDSVLKAASKWKISSTISGSIEKVFEFKLNN
ncbi:MAG: TonB family protein [Bacteriovorax sp.]|nr:TonB family protein [Bacteriovorax sp.]